VTTVNRRLAGLAIALATCAAACGGGKTLAGVGTDGRPGPDAGADAPRPDGAPTPDGATPDSNPTSDGGSTPDGPATDTTPPRDSNATDGGGPTGPLSWAGVYDADGVWDLSGPITAQRTLGDVVADLLIDQIVSLAGVPSAIEDQAKSVVRALVGGKIKSIVDAVTPAPLKPGSDLFTKLTAVLASAQVTSTIDVYPGSAAGSVEGSEELRAFKFTFQGRTATLPVGDLLERTVPLITLGAEWEGKQSGADVLVIDQHEFALRLGKMILWIVDNVLEEAGGPSLSQTAASVIDCNAITSAITGGKSSFSFGVGFLSFSVGTSSLNDGCRAATAAVAAKALGLFDMDAGVSLGGQVQALDDDADAVADRLKSLAGFGGSVTDSAIAPRVAARFEAFRRHLPGVPNGFGPNYADMSNSIGTTARLPLRGRIIRVIDGFSPATTTPFAQISQEELPNEPVTITTGGTTLGVVTTDGEGYIDQALDISAAKLAPGTHALGFVVRGRLAGTASASLLSPQAPGLVVRSDVDLTYLDTHFMSTTDKLALLIQRGGERAALPAMSTVYRGLRRGATSAEDVPLTYLSGSPNFFKMVLEEKMRVDLIAQDGVVLKPFKDIIVAKVTDVDPGAIVPALEEQVGYKLAALLRLRLDVPPDTKEILMGDDSEADAVAYALYHRFTSKQLTADGLVAAADAVPVDPTWRPLIVDLAARVAPVLPQSAPVVAIYINRTGTPNARFPVAGWAVPGLTRYHTGAWPLALDLFEEGRLSGPATAAVKARLIALGQSTATLSAAAQDAVTAGYVQAATVSAF